ncbi:MAG: transporter substrate-binding domain-containing protein, partial [Firmicutes bacterium]|nr:transporter substrate-binding domain-containing protein [Bacillota bacterium]
MNGKNKFLNMLIILLAVLVFTGCGSGSADFKKESPDSLDGKRVGIVTGSSYDKNITKNYPGAKIKFFASTTDMITALKTNKIDAFIEDKPKAELILRQDDSLTSNDTGFGNFDMAYIFARTPKGALLCGKFDKFIEEQRKNGNLKKLEQKWLGDDESQKIPPDPGALAVNTEVLDMATEGESAPFSYIKDGKYAGYDIELAYMFCKENGYALEVKNMAHDALIPAVDSDKCDFAGAGIDVTGERSEEIYFSKPTYNTGSAVVTVKVKETKQGLIL